VTTAAPRPAGVLIVDDAPTVRRLVSVALDAVDEFEVVGEAGDGVRAVEEVKRNRPDVVVLDLSMPRMGGLEALPLIREASPSSTVVVFSAFETSDTRELALQRGAAACIEKDAGPVELVDRLIDLVERERGPGSAQAPG
jgi:DNA-binding NarL/FixJ family response regulator